MVRTLRNVMSVLMIGIFLAGSLISCEGNVNSLPSDEEVEVKASVIDETKSLEAYFGDTVANNVTHYRWVMTHRNPNRVYDTGYVERSVAESGFMYANMNGTAHKILTGEYDWVFTGYVNDGAGTADANYHKVAEVSKSGEIVNAKTSSIAIVLDTLKGQNQGAEITAKLPVEFYAAYTADPASLILTVKAEKIGGGAGEFIVTPNSISDAGTNSIKIVLPSFETGSYNLSVQIDLMQDLAVVDSKKEVTILRSITDSVAKGEMNFASTSLSLENLGVVLTDKTGNVIIAEASMDSFNLIGLDPDDYTNTTTADITLRYPHTDGISVVWYIDGTEAGTEKIEVYQREASQEPDVEKYKIKAGAIEEGTHIVAAILVDRNMNMSAGSVTFTVTVAETDPSAGNVQPATDSDVKGYIFKGNSGADYYIAFGQDGRFTQVMDMAPTESQTPRIHYMSGSLPYSISDGTITVEMGVDGGGYPQFDSRSITYNPDTEELVMEGSPAIIRTDLSSVSDNVLAQVAAEGVNYDGSPTLPTAEMKGYWEQCGSDGSAISPAKMWVWLGGNPSDTYQEKTKNAAFGALVSGTAQGTQIASRWNLHGTRNFLSIIVADATEGEMQKADTLCYTFEVSKSGDIYALKVIYSMNYNDPNLTVGNTYYFKTATMDSAVTTELTNSGITL